MATWSGSAEEDDAISMSMDGLLLEVERIMSASAIQLISVGWREGRIPVLERMESPFCFFWADDEFSLSLGDER